MSLRRGTATTGVFAGAADAAFRRRCLEFLRLRLTVYRPTLILTLGRFAPSLIAPLSPALEAWQGTPSLKRIDTTGPLGPVACEVVVATADAPLTTTIVALTHPSLRHLSIHRGFTGP